MGDVKNIFIVIISVEKMVLKAFSINKCTYQFKTNELLTVGLGYIIINFKIISFSRTYLTQIVHK